MRSQEETHYLGDGCVPPHAMGSEPPVGIKPLPPVGPEIRHLTVTAGDIDRLLAWHEHVAAAADDTYEDFRLAEYLAEMRDRQR